MKNILKQFLAALVLVSVAGGVYAQSGRTADQAKLPSNRPMPDPRILQRKIELMRAHAPKPNAHGRQENLLNPAQPVNSPTMRAYPNDINRPVRKPAVN